MDVNGTYFHLITTCRDWSIPSDASSPAFPPFADGSEWENVEYIDGDDYLQLKRVPPIFPQSKGSVALEPDARRGAAVDKIGNWYWIANDCQRIFWQPTGAKRPLVYWDPSSLSVSSGATPFRSCQPVPGVSDLLAGLAVTKHHYLVVGDVTRSGVHVFDLQAGGAPTLICPFSNAAFPASDADLKFAPFDMAATQDGGVWILDRQNCCYWGLDARFRPILDPSIQLPPPLVDAPHFLPVDGTEVLPVPIDVPSPFFLQAKDPVAIEALNDGSVLVLDSPWAADNDAVAPTGSVILHYRLSQSISPPTALQGVEVAVTDDGSTPLRPVLGHDFVYLPPPASATSLVTKSALNGVLFVVDRDGLQTIAFALPQLNFSGSLWQPLFDYLPMQYFGNRALVGNAGRIYYDVVGGNPARDAGVRWMELQVIDQPRFETEATLVLIPPIPVNPAAVDEASGFLPGEFLPLVNAFDGKVPGCVWHRVLVDGCLPPGSTMEVWARASDEPDLLDSASFVQQPDLYLRSSTGGGDTGCEIPYYRPFGSAPLPAPKGTWELLLQNPIGRYLQVKLVLRGNGRVSPEIHAIRIYYPRFSYLTRYMPRVYQNDPSSASFLERLLANMEGFLTETDGKIEGVPVLFDARTAVPEALDWLAGWIGLVMDPLWATLQQRRLADPGLLGQLDGPISSACTLPPSGVADVGATTSPDPKTAPVIADRRRLVIRTARILYQRRGTPDGILFALHLLLDPCLETTLRDLKRAATDPTAAILTQLDALSLARPTPSTSDAALEDLLYAMLTAPGTPSAIRIIESFLTRGGNGALEGDPDASTAATPMNATRADPTAAFSALAAASAHRFSVLVPAGLSDDEQVMITRVVSMEKPAHTLFDVRFYWEGFRIGTARLGLDTALGNSGAFEGMILGRDYLADGYLVSAPPGDALDRLVADRDRLGCLPAL